MKKQLLLVALIIAILFTFSNTAHSQSTKANGNANAGIREIDESEIPMPVLTNMKYTYTRDSYTHGTLKPVYIFHLSRNALKQLNDISSFLDTYDDSSGYLVENRPYPNRPNYTTVVFFNSKGEFEQGFPGYLIF